MGGWAQGFGRGRGRARGILDRVRLRLGCAVTTAVRRQNRAVGKWCPGLRLCAGLPLGAPWQVAREYIVCGVGCTRGIRYHRLMPCLHAGCASIQWQLTTDLEL